MPYVKIMVCQIFMKFGVGGLYETFLSVYNFRENGLSDSLILLGGSKRTSTLLPIFIYRFVPKSCT
jgi:hypothetical protein